MTYQNNIKIADSDNTDQLINLLDALQPSKQQQKTLLFQKLFHAIERALDRDVPQKKIIDELKESGLSLSMGGFRSLLESERKLRTENGERIRCESCGAAVPKPMPTLANLTASKDKELEVINDRS